MRDLIGKYDSLPDVYTLPRPTPATARARQRAKGRPSSSFLRTSSPRGSRRPSATRSTSGSRTTGAIDSGSLRTGEGDILVEGGPDVAGDDRAATGLKVDRYGRLFVSGADSKHIRVYDARTGAQLRDYFAGDDAGFINDVIVTRRGAYFTDSNNAWLYFIPFGARGQLGELGASRSAATTSSIPGSTPTGSWPPAAASRDRRQVQHGRAVRGRHRDGHRRPHRGHRRRRRAGQRRRHDAQGPQALRRREPRRPGSRRRRRRSHLRGQARPGTCRRAGSPARSTATCSRSRRRSRAPAAATTWSMRSSACPTPTARSRS